jgi:hypothetical protein
MTYTADHPILGKGTVTAAGIQSFFIERGKAAAPTFAPNKRYKAPPDDIGQVIVELANQHGINHDMMAAMIGHESAWWQSRIVRDKNNPSGLGATNDAPYENAITFPSPWYGVRATVAHLLSYTLGDSSPLKSVSPRHEVLRPLGYLGIAKVWRDLNGRWAWPGTTYAQSIASRANDMVMFAKARGEIIEQDKPVADLTKRILDRVSAHGVECHDIRSQMPVHSRLRYQALPNTNWTHLAYHFTAGGRAEPNFTRAQDVARWQAHGRWHVNNNNWPGIAYAFGFSPSGRVFALRNVNLWGFHAGNANTYALGIAGDFNVGQVVSEKALRAAAVIAHVLIHETPELPNLTQPNIRGHRDFMSTACPGDELYRWVQQAQRGKLIDEKDKPVSNDLIINGKRLIGGFKGFYQSLGDRAIAILGLPLTDEFTADVDGVERTVQLFERAALGWYPQSLPHGVPPNHVMHIRCLTLAEAKDVLEQAMKQKLL